MKLSSAFAILLVSAKSTVLQGACDFCPAGFDDPNVQLPLGDIFSAFGSMGDFSDADAEAEANEMSCQDIQNQAAAAPASECEAVARIEPLCCPSTTEQYICDFCPEGIEAEDNFICGFVLFAALAANETVCAGSKIYEPICCPSTSEYKLPPIVEGDTCYICGSADVAMNTPDAIPMFLDPGSAGDGPTAELTCAQRQDALNEQRESSGVSCFDTLSMMYLSMSPSACGCEGFEAPNACKLCDGGSVNRSAIAIQGDDESITCGQGYDMFSHMTPGSCALLGAAGDDFDFDAIDKACCTYTTESDSSVRTNGLSFAGLLIGSLVAMTIA